MTTAKSRVVARRGIAIAIVIAETTVLAGVGAAAEPSASGNPVVGLELVAPANVPVDLAWRIDDDALYVVQQDGFIIRVDGDGVDPEQVLDVSDLAQWRWEQGLLGLAFSPDGATGYVNYVDFSDDTVIAAFAVDEAGVFDRDSMRVVMTIERPETNHNGGDLEFGPDGMLYFGVGDGGGFGDPERRAQDRSLLFGKLLRIDPTPSDGQEYTIPPDNPFVGVDGVRPEIWSEGLRNPWKFSFDPVTADLWIADVGEGSWEEIDVVAPPGEDGTTAGRAVNFGWSAFEGNAPFNADQVVANHTPPIYEYPHDGRCSISGGVRGRGESAGALDGWYVFGDFCSGELFALEVLGEGASLAAGRVVALPGAAVASVTAVRHGPDGSLYVLGDGMVNRLVSGAS